MVGTLGLVLSFLFLLLPATFVSGQVQPDPVQQKRLNFLEKRVVDLEKESANLRKELASMQLPRAPENLILCDRAIPLWREDVRERFEREFYLILENRGLLTILIKRLAKYTPSILNDMEKLRLPPDLIYLAVAESYLNPRVVSTAGAGGMWQFIRETGRREGLSIQDAIDERYSIPLSTTAALAHLRRLYTEFNDWFLVMASYNCGPARVREALSGQNARDFFDLFLPEETERYVMRIAAFKEILSKSGKYGIDPDKNDFYSPFSACDVILTVSRDTHTTVLAQAADLPYKAFRDHNLHLRRYILPKGSYHIFIPLEKRDTFFKKVRDIPGVSVERGA